MVVKEKLIKCKILITPQSTICIRLYMKQVKADSLKYTFSCDRSSHFYQTIYKSFVYTLLKNFENVESNVWIYKIHIKYFD